MKSWLHRDYSNSNIQTITKEEYKTKLLPKANSTKVILNGIYQFQLRKSTHYGQHESWLNKDYSNNNIPIITKKESKIQLTWKTDSTKTIPPRIYQLQLRKSTKHR